MKLSITQTMLGIVIIVAACFILAWMIFWTSPSQTAPLAGPGTPEKLVQAFPKEPMTYTAARYASGALLFFGVLVVIISVRQAARTKHPTLLAAIQLSLGTLIAVTSAFITARGYPLVFVTPLQTDSNLIGQVNINPGPGMAIMILFTLISLLFGLAVCGVGIGQLIKAQRKAVAQPISRPAVQQ